MNDGAYGTPNLMTMGVSKQLSELKALILKLGGELETKIHGKVAWFVDDALKQLDSHVCKIAFIGQIKAGKSSLINALVHRPGLLPTDVNPSTAVVTKLFIGPSPHDANTALLHFFSENEWETLLTPAPRDGQSTRLDLSHQSRELEKLQNRAQSRLGDGYRQLFGKHHLLSSISGDALSRYVSVGDYQEPKTANYSDLTKLAEIFLGGSAIAYPAAIVDTPGVNDQFFMRDEVTLANLADADIYVLVLSAENPLASEDLSLLRILRGLHKEKIIAVINRIDVLAGSAEDLTRVEAFVRGRLKREFPSVTIPVVQASALWANTAISKSRLDKSSKHFEPSTETMNRQMLQRSGVPKLIGVIERYIGIVVTEQQLLPAASTFAAIAENTAIASRYGITSFIARTRTASNLAAMEPKIKASLAQLQRLISAIDETLSGAAIALRRLTQTEIAQIERYMHYEIYTFAEEQAFQLSQHAFAKSFAREFSNAALRFRADLAENFARLYAEIHRTLVFRQSQVEADIRKISKAVLPELDNVLQFGITSSRPTVPSITSLGRASTLEKPDFWSHNAVVDFTNDAHALEDVKLLITSEFIGITKQMTAAAEAELMMENERITSRLKLIVFSSIFPLVSQMEELAATHLKAQSAPDPVLTAQFGQRIETSLAFFTKLSSELKEAKKQCFLLAAG